LDYKKVLSAGTYIIRPVFDSGKCKYYNFEDVSIPEKTLTIEKANINISLSDIERVYGSYLIDNDNYISILGTELFNKDDYTVGIYLDPNGVNKVDLNYLTDAGSYYLVVKLNYDTLSTNFNFKKDADENDIIVYSAKYTILQREVNNFEIKLDGMLREDGSRLNDRIKIVFNESEFVDEIIPDYEVVFIKNGRVVNSVINEGVYTVRITFVDNNYICYTEKTFTVYEPQSYKNIIILISAIAVGIVGVIAVVITVKVNRKKMKNKLQKVGMNSNNKKTDNNVANNDIKANTDNKDGKAN